MFKSLYPPLKYHSYNDQSFQSVIQKNALEDTAVTNKMQWDNSISFMERILKERIDFANDDLEKCIGMFLFFISTLSI